MKKNKYKSKRMVGWDMISGKILHDIAQVERNIVRERIKNH